MPAAARPLGGRVSLADPGVWPCPLGLALRQGMLGAQRGLRQGCDRWKQGGLPGGGEDADPGLEGGKGCCQEERETGIAGGGAARRAAVWGVGGSPEWLSCFKGGRHG